jgi:hypothetical protein
VREEYPQLSGWLVSSSNLLFPPLNLLFVSNKDYFRDAFFHCLESSQHLLWILRELIVYQRQ